jgi:predicted dienelactone hydrolase
VTAPLLPRTALLVAAFICFPVLAGPGAARETVDVPVDLFEGQPRGPYQTGTFEEMWVDERRAETTTSDPADKRRLMVQIWYPAAYEGSPPRAPYALHGELYSREPGLLAEHPEAQWVYGGWLDDVTELRSTSVLRAPLAAEPRRFPVLLYNPGAGFAAFSATFQTEFLASHGYVVVGISHTDATGIERFPDGTSYEPDATGFELTAEEASGLSPVENFRKSVARIVERLMPVHVADIGFVLDRLQAMDRERGNRFRGRLDLERVGSLGWSLGGALSLQASRDEPRIKAAVNLDGWLYTDVQDTGTRRPVMVIHANDPFAYGPDETAAERERRLVAEALPWQLYARTDADWYDVSLAGGGHMHFSDQALFMPEPIRKVFIPGEASARDPRGIHAIANRLTLEFFDRYLRQRASAPLLCGDLTDPAASVRRRGTNGGPGHPGCGPGPL